MNDNITVRGATISPIVIYPVILKRKLSSSGDLDDGGDEGEIYEVVSGKLITTALPTTISNQSSRPRKALKRRKRTLVNLKEMMPPANEADAAFDHQFDKEEAEKQIHTEMLDCLVCSLSVQAETFSEHMEKEHQGKGTHQCSACKVSRLFTTKEEYDKHVSEKHSNSSNGFQCKDCRWVVDTMEQLSLHAWSNHQDGQFYCSLCLYGPLNRRCLVRQHYQTEHIEGRKEILDILQSD